MSRSLKLMTILICATMAVSACGKRGALEPPPSEDGTPAAKDKKVKKSKDGYGNSQPAGEHKPFVLDGLLR
jgi:predicted small lipoprotein YifL